MTKVLLLLEDYNELIHTENFLKKVGFDVAGLNTEVGLTEKILGFRPEIIVSSGYGSRISGLNVGKKIKDLNKFNCKLVLIFPQTYKPSIEELSQLHLDAILEAPIDQKRLIEVLAKLSGQNPSSVVDKFKKMQTTTDGANKIPEMALVRSQSGLTNSNSDTNYVQSSTESLDSLRDPNVVPSAIMLPSKREDHERVSKYDKFTQGMHIDSSHTTINRVEARSKWQELRKAWNMKFLEGIDDLKRKFAQALFKKDLDS